MSLAASSCAGATHIARTRPCVPALSAGALLRSELPRRTHATLGLSSNCAALPLPSLRVVTCSLRPSRLCATALDADASSTSAAPDDEVADSRKFAVAMASILNDTKCQDIVVLDVSPLVSWTSFMVFGTVASKPQLMAALGRVEKMAQEQYDRQQQNTPGSSPWECLDFGDCVLHVMSTEQREFYDLESFYATAEEVELPFEQERPTTEDEVPKWTLQQPAV